MANADPITTTPEEWRDVPGYEGKYQVSNHGRVKSLARGVERSDGRPHRLKERILKPGHKRHGYPYVVLHGVRIKQETRNIHELVALAFLPPRPSRSHVVRHYDDNPVNNAPENLLWGTQADNIADTIRNGNHAYAKRGTCGRGHPYIEENTKRYAQKGKARVCIACSRARAYSNRRKEWKPRLQELSDWYFQKISG